MLTQQLQKNLETHTNKALLRQRIAVHKRFNNSVEIDGQTCINFCSNDYLGMSQHADVIQAFTDGVKIYGVGSTASPMVSGYFKIQEKVEAEFAEFLNVEKTIFFNSGYAANLGVITALANKNSTIISDKLCHASMLDGIQLSRAKHFRYKHNDLHHLTELLNSKSANLIITEAVFSMEGDIAPLPKIISLAKTNKCEVIVDDAHGIGTLEKHGRGTLEYFNLKSADVTCLIAPLGKAFACMGCIVAGDKLIIDNILQFARSYRYSTALPPALYCAILQALKIIKADAWRREKLAELIHYFIAAANRKGLRLVSNDITPIKSIIVGDNAKVVAIQKALLKKGFFVSAIRPPTVAEGTARIRISLNCLHSKTEINSLIVELSKLCLPQ